MLDSLWAVFENSSESEGELAKPEQLQLILNLFIILRESKSRDYLLRSMEGGSSEGETRASLSPLSALRHNVLQHFSIPSEKIPFLSALESFSAPGRHVLASLVGHLRPFIENPTFLSRLYESYVSFKHQRGTFYTPRWMIEAIFEILKQKVTENPRRASPNPLTIADISCGAGNFLEVIPTFFPQAKILGVDIDPLALEIAYLNFKLFSDRKSAPSSELSLQFFRRDSLKSDIPQSPFDIVCGNPPWGTDVDPYQKLLKTHYAALIRSEHDPQEYTGGKSPRSPLQRPYKIRDQLDIYSLFVMRNLKLLKKGGFLALVIPSTLLFNPVYEPLRKYLLKTTTLHQIFYLGEDVFVNVKVPSIILVLEKTPAPITHPVVIAHMVHNTNLTASDPKFSPQWDSQQIPQQTFTQHPFSNFTIFTSQDTLNLVQQIEQTPHYVFGDFVSNSRGVEIGKQGRIYQCPFCKKWNPLSHFKKSTQLNTAVGTKCNGCKQFVRKDQMTTQTTIIESTATLPNTEDHTMWVPLVRGEDLHRYHLQSDHSIKLGYKGIKYKHPDKYHSPKILLRKTGKGIIGALDYASLYTLQVIYQFALKYVSFKSSLNILHDSTTSIDARKLSSNDYSPHILRQYSIEFLFGIISSNIIELYYHNNFANPKKKSFPHLIQANVLALPIPKINFTNSQSQSYKLYHQIEEKVYSIKF